ncbi:hypothetical protein BDZ89DRAFT_1191718 [Hymenopellis radicata]|nr:hypothetical protein BDZ89DRAFT_1191718 [Hymenopellis radicata]
MSSEASSSSAVPERSLNRQVVLDEDEYTAALSHIIARDFFPSLTVRDPHLISASVRRIEQLNETPIHGPRSHVIPMATPMETPYVSGGRPFDTPMSVRDQPPLKRARYDDSLSLDSFQARYTSEDNSSFTEILDSENQARKEKWGWAWDAQRRVADKNLLVAASREQMLLEGPSGSGARPGVRERILIEPATVAGFICDSAPADEEDEKGKGKEKALAVVWKKKADEEEETDVMAPLKEPRHAGMDGWKFKARNALMFPPDADETPYYKPPTVDTKSADVKVIKYNSTRLSEQDDRPQQLSAPPSPTRSRIDAAIQGTPYHPRSPGSNKFKLVPNLPSPTASELGPTAVKELMTWGTLNATPRIISQKRISHKLSNNASKSLRAKATLLGVRTPGLTPMPGRKGSMPPPSWTPRRSEAAGNLTPAAKRLLDRTTMGALASRRAEAMERTSGWATSQPKERDMKRIRWTPTPGM